MTRLNSLIVPFLSAVVMSAHANTEQSLPSPSLWKLTGSAQHFTNVITMSPSGSPQRTIRPPHSYFLNEEQKSFLILNCAQMNTAFNLAITKAVNDPDPTQASWAKLQSEEISKGLRNTGCPSSPSADAGSVLPIPAQG